MEKHNLHSRGTLGLNDNSDDGNTFTDVCVATDAGVSSEKSVRLFGVKLIDYNPHMGMMRKSVSMGNLGLVGFSALQRCQESRVYMHTESVTAAQTHSEAGDGIGAAAHGKPQQGYVSDGLMQTSSMCLRERKKGVPWTEEEHRLFLAGLQTLGKGDWRGISRNFVTSRTPTQVASHAQKYFLRQCNLNKRKRRSSLFDIINSTMVQAGTDISIGEHTHAFASTELNQSTVKLGLQHVMTSSTSPMNSFSPYSKLPSIATHSPTLRADLCLGRSYTQQGRMLADDVLSTAAPGKQSSMLNTLRSADFLSSNHPADIEKTNFNTSIYKTSSLSSSPKSLSSSPSSSSSLCRIDEMSELSSLSLRIGPPVSLEVSELTLKLEQPTISSRHSAIRSSARVCEVDEVFCAAGASTVSGNTNTVTSMANAISVV